MTKWRSKVIFVIMRVENPEHETIVKAYRNKGWAMKEVERLNASTTFFHRVQMTNLFEEAGF